MAHLLLVCSLHPRTQERWQRLFQELAGLRHRNSTACQQI
jgi:hypothetical protein